ncbi:MAG: sugar nucleotide-binding protein [Verrucomicrobiae bacterium]|nr:sugar nucleotide-binding protein [Verrucomicrobiae bacterium]
MKLRHLVLLGGSGYIGQTFQEVLQKRGISFRNFSRSELDYYHPQKLVEALKQEKPDCLINAAGYTGKPNVDACEDDKANCLLGNAVLPGVIREVCESQDIPWGHVSSGCIYTSKGTDGRPFVEEDKPNFSFRTNNCSFYSGTKALGEEVLDGAEKCYIWRLRIPFDERNNPRNYLSKLLHYEWLLDAENSISQRFEFIDACLKSFEMDLPYGKYNVTNPGSISAREITEIMKKHGLVKKELKFFESEEAFMNQVVRAPRSNCVMSSEKLTRAGIHMTEVHEAVDKACANWIE